MSLETGRLSFKTRRLSVRAGGSSVGKTAGVLSVGLVVDVGRMVDSSVAKIGF